MGLPFLPVCGVRGSDIAPAAPGVRGDHLPVYRRATGRGPPLRPDVALLHAPSADRYGNLHLAQPYVLDERFASAARTVIATADEMVAADEVTSAGITIPAHLVTAVAEVPFGAHPSSCYPRYAYDRNHLHEYVAAAQAGPEDPDKYLDTYVTTARRATGRPSAPTAPPAWPWPVHGRRGRSFSGRP